MSDCYHARNYSIRPVLDGTKLPTGNLQAGTGSLVFNPSPADLGTYQIEVTATDGVETSVLIFTLNVVADPITTTRICGRVLDVDQSPIVGMRVEIGGVQGLTMADGSFLLDVGTGQSVSDTIKIRGELFTGPRVYPFIAEKLSLLLEHDVYTGKNNVVTRPIFLPALDMINAKQINPSQNTLVTTNAIPGASVLVSAGTLMNQQGTPFIGRLGITEVSSFLTPAALPDNLNPDLVITVQPGEMVFTTPAPLTLPNRAGFAPGTKMDLWSINPTTGRFDNVGTGQVSSDGKVIETVSGGIRFSSWQFFAIKPGAEANSKSKDNDRTKKNGCNACATKNQIASEVELFSGALLEDHSLVSYESLGVSRGMSIHYNSLQADPRPIVHGGFFDVEANSEVVTRVTVRQGAFTKELPGYVPQAPANGFVQFPDLSGGEHFFQTPSQRGSADFGLQLDFRDVPTGQYEYTITSAVTQRWTQTVCLGISFFQPDGTNLCSGSRGSVERVSYTTRSDSDMLIEINRINGPFGSGWGLASLQELVQNGDGSLLLVCYGPNCGRIFGRIVTVEI